MREIGNAVARDTWEKNLPKSHRRGCAGDDPVLIEQWIRSKYEVYLFLQIILIYLIIYW